MDAKELPSADCLRAYYEEWFEQNYGVKPAKGVGQVSAVGFAQAALLRFCDCAKEAE